MSTTHASLQSLPDDTEGLRALVLTLMAKLDEVSNERDSLQQQNDRIHHLLLKLKRMQFGAKSERLPEEQLQLGLEALEQAIARNEVETEKHDGAPGLCGCFGRTTVQQGRSRQSPCRR